MSSRLQSPISFCRGAELFQNLSKAFKISIWIYLLNLIFKASNIETISGDWSCIKIFRSIPMSRWLEAWSRLLKIMKMDYYKWLTNDSSPLTVARSFIEPFMYFITSENSFIDVKIQANIQKIWRLRRIMQTD